MLLLVGAVLLPALVDRQVDEGLLEGIPVAQAQEVLAAPAPPTASPEALVGTSKTPASPAAPAPASPAAAAPVRLSAGDIRGVGHRASGQAAVYRSGQTTFVRLEDLKVQGAIDVVVYLVPGADQVNPDGGVSLGSLKGTQGNAHYVMPGGTDLEQYGAVLLWCRAVSTPIAAATQT